MTNEVYTLQRPGGFIDHLSLKKRLKMLELFSSEFPLNSFSKVLDVGVTADNAGLTSSNYFEKHFPAKEKIIALSNQDANCLEQLYPGLQFKRGDAKAMPFADSSIDVVFSSAVIEHVGSWAAQKQMIAECYRVAKQGVFLATPNRWHPMEVHTLLPLLHWLPKRIHRAILKLIGLKFFALEENLNLLDQRTLARACGELGIRQYSFHRIKTFGFTSNLVLVIRK